jgi:hypothetical protein
MSNCVDDVGIALMLLAEETPKSRPFTRAELNFSA